jgi:hypothetical protein
VIDDAVIEELHGEYGLAATGVAGDKARATLRQSAPGHLVEALDASEAFGENLDRFLLSIQCGRHGSPFQPFGNKAPAVDKVFALAWKIPDFSPWLDSVDASKNYFIKPDLQSQNAFAVAKQPYSCS